MILTFSNTSTPAITFYDPPKLYALSLWEELAGFYSLKFSMLLLPLLSIISHFFLIVFMKELRACLHQSRKLGPMQRVFRVLFADVSVVGRK